MMPSSSSANAILHPLLHPLLQLQLKKQQLFHLQLQLKQSQKLILLLLLIHPFSRLVHSLLLAANLKMAAKRMAKLKKSPSLLKVRMNRQRQKHRLAKLKLKLKPKSKRKGKQKVESEPSPGFPSNKDGCLKKERQVRNQSNRRRRRKPKAMLPHPRGLLPWCCLAASAAR